MIRRHRARAFTLIELLLAMSLMVFVVVPLYTALRVGLASRRSAISATEPMRVVSIVADLVRQDLESIPPPTGIFAGPFTGVQDAVQFCTIGRDDPRDESPLSEGIRQVEILLRSDVTPPALVRRVTRNLTPALTSEYEEELLCRDVRAFSLRYWDGMTWQESWDSTTVGDVLPIAVAITVEVGDPARPDGPPRRASIVVPLACARPSDSAMMEGL